MAHERHIALDSTSVSLLRRLKDRNEIAWSRFVDLYAPLVYFWGKQQGLNPEDAGDLVQEVMHTVFQKIPDFQYDPKRRFRGWLRTIAVNKSRDFQRRNRNRPSSGLTETHDAIAVAPEVDVFDRANHRAHLIRRAVEMIKPEFRQRTWLAFYGLVFEGKSGRQLAEELGMSEGAVYVAKSRVCKRLRHELDGLFD